MKQRELIAKYNDIYRPKFNYKLFHRSDDDLINALRYVIYSCERDRGFKIKILNFEIIDKYDDINHILYEYEESIINKNRSSDDSKSSSNSNKKKDNQFAYINLKGSAIKLIKVTYYVGINEKKDGWVEDEVVVYIAIPRIVNGFYFRINGNIYSAMYQIVDASTYNNSASKNAKKQSLTFKTTFMPIRVYRYTGTLNTKNDGQIKCIYFVANMFRKSLLLMTYFLAKFGFYGSMEFLHVSGVFIVNDLSSFNEDEFYAIPIRDFYIVVSKFMYKSVQIIQSFVYTLHSILVYMKDTTFANVFNIKVYINALGAEFTAKTMDTIYDKGINILGSLEFIYDDLTKNDLKLDDYDKEDCYCVLRWMMYEYTTLRKKDNINIATKKVRCAEYLAALYANRLTLGIYRVSDKGERADLNTIKKAVQIPPMYLINAITKCQLVNYKNCVNDLDALIALKYTYKGVSGIGEKSNAISGAYRTVHPSHLGRVDIDSSSNSDPGVSGTICPLVTLYDGHFTEYKEPSTWQDDVNKVTQLYRSMISKKQMYTLLEDNNLYAKQKDNSQEKAILDQEIYAAKIALDLSLFSLQNEEYLDGYDLFGDGYFYYENIPIEEDI